MRLIVESSNSAAMNLAIEEAIIRGILEEKVEETIRFWVNPPCVVIGRFQVAALNCDLDYCKRNNIEVIRRESSGGAVFQDEGNWNHSIFVKNPEKFVDKGQDIYASFSSLMVETLQKLGIPASFSPPNDIILNNKKISGAAQFELYDVLLHHATLLVNTDLQRLSHALIVPYDKLSDKQASSILERVTTIEKEGFQIKDIHALADAYRATVEEHFNLSVTPSQLSAFEKELANELYELKYKNPDWNIELIPLSEELKWFNCKIPKGLLQIGVGVSDKNKITEIVFTGDLSIKNFDLFSDIRRRLLFAPLRKKELINRLTDINLELCEIDAEKLVDMIIQATDKS